MLKFRQCKNDPGQVYLGSEPTPRGRGWSATAVDEGTIMTGRDGHEYRAERKTWVRNSTSSSTLSSASIDAGERLRRVAHVVHFQYSFADRAWLAHIDEDTYDDVKGFMLTCGQRLIVRINGTVSGVGRPGGTVTVGDFVDELPGILDKIQGRTGDFELREEIRLNEAKQDDGGVVRLNGQWNRDADADGYSSRRSCVMTSVLEKEAGDLLFADCSDYLGAKEQHPWRCAHTPELDANAVVGLGPYALQLVDPSGKPEGPLVWGRVDRGDAIMLGHVIEDVATLPVSKDDKKRMIRMRDAWTSQSRNKTPIPGTAVLFMKYFSTASDFELEDKRQLIAHQALAEDDLLSRLSAEAPAAGVKDG